MLTPTLAAVALLAGLAGAWSPCGLSMVETLAPGGYAGRRRTAAAASAAFAAGALAGGLATFGGLGVLGSAVAGPGHPAATAALSVAVAALVAAALGDAAGRRIVPQVRRQVPESWRRVLPVPLAAGAYGALLGLGFTTFVLSFASWALAVACLALGDPATGAAVGLAFGAGRAIPVLALAPFQDRDGPASVAAAMVEHPVVLRGLRGAAAAGLGVAAVALAAAPPAAGAVRQPTAGATQAQTFADAATDPSASGLRVAWHGSDGVGRLWNAGQVSTLPGAHPAVAGELVAWTSGDQVVVANAATSQPIASHAAPGADAVALSDRLVAWRAPGPNGRDAIFAADHAAPAGSPPVLVGAARPGGALGRPVAEGTHVLFDAQSPGLSRLLDRDVATGGIRRLRTARGHLLLAPDVDAGRLLYVRSTARRQQVRLGRWRVASARRDRVVYGRAPTARRDAGRESGRHDHRAGYPGGRRPRKPPRPPLGVTVTLWTAAVSGDAAYVTRLQHRSGGVTEARILRLGL